MSLVSVKVEIALTITFDDGTFFVLDDTTRGVLDNTQYKLSGELFYDISQYVKSVSIDRGRNRTLDRTDAGTASIVLDNRTRLFDPLYTSGFYYGALTPKREVRVYANNVLAFVGYADDYDLQYSLNGESTTTVSLSDGISRLTKAQLDEYANVFQFSGARVSAVLDNPQLNWPSDLRSIDVGSSYLMDDDIPQDMNALEYLQQVVDSELGNLFVDKAGYLTFRGRNYAGDYTTTVFGEGGVPFNGVSVVYGSELLYTQINLTQAGLLPDSVSAGDVTAQGLYGITTYSADNILLSTDAPYTIQNLQDMADYMLQQYKNPRYRFEQVTVQLSQLSAVQQATVLGLELGNIVTVNFTPNGVAPMISQLSRIIGISNDWGFDNQTISFSFETVDFHPLILNDTVWGQLDDDRLGF